MADLVLMAGVPGSGKTTLAKKLAGERDTYISRDEIRFSMVSENEQYFSKENEVLSRFIAEIDKAILSTERYVFADATHLTRESRGKVLRKLTNKPNHVYLLYFEIPLDVALQRNRQRKKRSVVPDPVIKNMQKRMELPNHNEGIDAVFIIDETGNIDISKTIVYGKGDEINDLFN